MLRPVDGHTPQLDSIALSGDGRHLAVASSAKAGFWLYTLTPPQVTPLTPCHWP